MPWSNVSPGIGACVEGTVPGVGFSHLDRSRDLQKESGGRGAMLFSPSLLACGGGNGYGWF